MYIREGRLLNLHLISLFTISTFRWEEVNFVKFSYARVSAVDQNLNMQMDALKKEDCKEIFQDYASGAKSDRGVLDNALEFMREDDVLVVWKFRIGQGDLSSTYLTL